MRWIIGGIILFVVVILYAVCANAGKISREEEYKELGNKFTNNRE